MVILKNDYIINIDSKINKQLMKLTRIALLLLVSAAVYSTTFGFEEEDNVVVLKDDTFKEAIAKFPFILVEFYAPWCGHCKQLAPEYSKAAAALKKLDTPIPLAKVDATENSESAQQYGVQGYPTIKFFVDGKPVDYNGGRTGDDIVNWIKKKTAPASTHLADAAALTAAKADNKVAVVFFGAEDHEDFAAYKRAAMNYDDVPFFHHADEAAGNGARVVVYTKHNNGEQALEGSVTESTVAAHIEEHRYPLVMEFEGDEAIKRIFQGAANAIFLFSDAETEFHTTFTELARADIGNDQPLIFSTSKVTQGLGQRLSEFVGVQASDAPCVWIVIPGQDLIKYKHKGDLTKEAVQTFVDQWRSGALERHFKSEDVPATNDEPVKIVVGKNFEEIVLNSGKWVLLEFYAPWCGHCKSLAPIYDELAKKYLANDKLVIAKIDATANEIPGISVQGFPTLKLFAPGKATPEDFSADRTLEGLEKGLAEKLGDDFKMEDTDL